MVVEQRLNEYIQDRGIRQAFICDRAGIDETLFSRSLAGKRDMKLDEFERVCRALKTDPNEFVKPDN